MTRARRLGAAIGALVLLLFAGRWAAGVLADRWWAAEVSPAAVAFLTQARMLHAVLKLAGVLIASAWFIGHFLVICRAVGSVQIRRHVADLEIREILTANTLVTGAVLGGAVLGALIGGSLSEGWHEVALAWHGVTYGVIEPFLERDIGLYLAQLPLWRSLQSFVFLLVVLALVLVMGLYLLAGAIRWLDGRPAITDHARRHLGWLLLSLSAALAWGYLLEPYEVVAGLSGTTAPGEWRVIVSAAPVLAGVALAAGGLSAIWALQPRHTLAAAGWVVLAVASIATHWLLPSMLDDPDATASDARAIERMTRMAYGLESVRVERVYGTDTIVPPSRPALWSAPVISHLTGGDSVPPLWLDPALVPVGEALRPAWLMLRPIPNDQEHLALFAIADDRAGPAGQPIFYRAGDTAASVSPAMWQEVSERIFRPEAPAYRLNTAEGSGVLVDRWFPRLVLGWALQVGALLQELPPGTRIDWQLTPTGRLAKLAPFAEWSRPVLRLVEGNPVWIVDGYIASSTFPLAHRTRWRNRTVGSVLAGFIGVVDANTGETNVYLRPGAGPVAITWATAAAGVVQPSASLPQAVRELLPYPAELFRLQAQELERAPWRAGALAGRPAPGSPPGEFPRTERHWGEGETGLIHAAVYDKPGGRTVAAIVTGNRSGGRDQLSFFRLDSTGLVPSRSVLERRWARFPSYDLLNDSVQNDGGRTELGPVRYETAPGGVIAYQPIYGMRASDRAALVWVSVAASGDRLGAGRSFHQAWGNLLGATAPLPAGTGERERLQRAREWFVRADSAVRIGDWTNFGAAWRELRRALGAGAGADTARP